MLRFLYLSPFPCLKIRTNNNLTQKKSGIRLGVTLFFMMSASVLGEVKYERATTENVDSLRSNGNYLHGGAIINGGAAGGYGILDVICAENIYVVQIDFDISNHAVFIRDCYKSGSGWHAWSSWKIVTMANI